MEESSEKNSLSDALIEHVYDSIAEPSNLVDFLNAWEVYVDDLIANSTIFMSEEASGPNDAALHATFTRGMSIFNRIGRSNSAGRDLQTLVDSLAGISLVTDKAGRILALNKMAVQAIQSDMDRGDTPLNTWIINRIQGWRQNTGGANATFLFSRQVSEHHDLQRSLLTVLVGTSTGTSENPDDENTYYLTSSVDLMVGDDTSSAIRDGFNFSQAETEIALRIMEGDPPAKIAAERGVSLHTVRAQIRSLLAKTESRGLPDLVRVLCSYAVKHASLAANLDFRGLNRSVVNVSIERSFRLKDGRVMHYRDMGDPQGTPVLFFHSIICGTELTEHAIETCHRAGFRIIAPALPGYWKSSAKQGVRREDLLKSNAADCAELLSDLKINQVIAMGHIVGSVSAQAFAVYIPAMVSGVLMVGHAGHFDPAFFRGMGSVHRVMGKTIMYAPKALSFIVRAAIALIDANDEEKLIRATHNPSEFDKLALRRPDIKDVVVRGIREGVAQGGDAFTQYSEVSMMDWLPHARRLTCPVTIMQGKRDELITEKYFTPYLKARPDANLIALEDAGKYMLYSHWPDVLSTLCDLKDKS